MIKCHNNKAEMYSMIFKTLTANLEWYFAHDNYLLFLLYAVNILSTKNGQFTGCKCYHTKVLSAWKNQFLL